MPDPRPADAPMDDAIGAIWRIESPKIIATLTRVVRDLGLAEDFAHDALVAALEDWPRAGIPPNPGAWLMTTAKRRAIDALRRRQLHHRKEDQIGYMLGAQRGLTPDYDTALDDDVGDDLLRLIFTSCHPALGTDARTALTLRLLGGLTTTEIARAFLVPEPTIQQRIVRAKKTIADKQLPFEVPQGAERAARLDSVLEVIYLIFNEGYAATAGDDWMRPALCDEAVRLARVVAELAPADAEVHGLAALLEIQSSRFAARIGPTGGPITLLDQDRSRWDRLLIGRGLTALDRARALAQPRRPYVLQAEIAACHARAATAADTDWAAIAALYTALIEIQPSPIVELNRAVAVSMAVGPARALPLVDALVAGGRLARYHLLFAVRGDLLAKLGRADDARREFERAAALTSNAAEQSLLRARAAACTGAVPAQRTQP